MKSEIEQAVLIQQSLLPQIAPDIDGFEICGKSIPAELVGGDLYDYFQHGENSFGVCRACCFNLIINCCLAI